MNTIAKPISYSIITILGYAIICTYTFLLSSIAAPSAPSWIHETLAILSGLVFIGAAFRAAHALLS
jgi:hypothetical protein